jgi:dethiobiotin synthetase/adenosylmethionine--8-amino-7-oxononanoate aminotransferase
MQVLALKGSYHGDTLGAMDAQAPSAYTGFLQQPWYSGRGLFLKPPTVYLRKGRWHLQLPEANYSDSKTNVEHSWESREEVFDADRDGTMLANMYSESIKKQLALSTTRKGSTSIAALIIEPGGFVSLISEQMSIWVHAWSSCSAKPVIQLQFNPSCM